MEKLDKTAKKIVRSLNFLSCFILMGMMIYLVIFIIIRGAFGYTIFGTYEIVQYSCMLVICLALADNDYQEGNVKVTVLTDLIPKKLRTIPELFALLLSCCICIAFTFFMFSFTIMRFNSNSLSLNFLIPVWIFALVLFVSFIMLSFSVVVRTIKYITKYKPKEIEEPNSMTGAL